MSTNTRPDSASVRVFGAQLPPSLVALWACGGFAGTSRIDLPARLLGALDSHAIVKNLVDRFDEDWFENPRSGSHLSGMAAGGISASWLA